MTDFRQKSILLLIATLLLTSVFLATLRLNKGIVKADTILNSDMPVAFVDPPNVTANVGENFTISLKIFNLSNNHYQAVYSWEPGEPLPEPGTWANYSLGNLYGVDMLFSWDPEVLEYVSHQKKIPVESYPDGLLHQDTLEILNEVDPDAGTYWVAESSLSPAPAFNAPEANVTVAELTFRVKKLGRSPLNFEEVQLVVLSHGSGYDNFRAECPHWVVDGSFETETLATRLETMEVGVLIGDNLLAPLMSGEDATIRVNVTNDASVADVFNLSITKDTSEVFSWQNMSIEAGERMTLNHTIAAEDLNLGSQTITTSLSSDLLKAAGVDFDNATFELGVVGTPSLDIQGPTTVKAGSNPTFDASGSFHNDPAGEIWNYTWSIYGPDEPIPRDEQTGGSELVTYTFEIKDTWPAGNWTVVLSVKDNFGVEYGGNRPATAAYRMEWNLEVLEATGQGLFTLENAILVIIIVVVVALLIIYLRRRSR